MPLSAALAALRDDLQAQEPPPSVLAGALRVARRAARTVDAPAVASAAVGFGRADGVISAPVAGTPRAQPGPAVGHSEREGDLAGAARGHGRGPGWRAWLAWPAWGERVVTAGPRALFASIGPWTGAATCAAVLGISLLLTLRPPALPAPAPGVDVAGGAAAPWPASGHGGHGRPDAGQNASATGWMPAMHFVPLVSAERMQALAAAQADRAGAAAAAGAEAAAWVVTTEVPQQRLAELGLPYDPGHAAEPVRAELLVAGSGEVLAVRFLLF